MKSAPMSSQKRRNETKSGKRQLIVRREIWRHIKSHFQIRSILRSPVATKGQVLQCIIRAGWPLSPRHIVMPRVSPPPCIWRSPDWPLSPARPGTGRLPTDWLARSARRLSISACLTYIWVVLSDGQLLFDMRAKNKCAFSFTFSFADVWMVLIWITKKRYGPPVLTRGLLNRFAAAGSCGERTERNFTF